MSKIYAILSGDDWYDASVNHVILPPGMSIEVEKQNYEKWYKEVYRPAIETGIPKINFINFIEWLIQNGARNPTSDELEEFKDD